MFFVNLLLRILQSLILEGGASYSRIQILIYRGMNGCTCNTKAESTKCVGSEHA